MTHLSSINFFGTNHYYYFHLTIGPFHCKIFLKNLTTDPELWCAIFGSKMIHLPQTNFFWIKLLISFSSTYWSLSLFKTLKKFFQRIQSYEDASLLGLKWPICPNEIFFIKCFKKPCFFHLRLSTCQNRNWSVKGYLRYKMITFQNVPSEAQIKNFLFPWKVLFHSQDIQAFVFLTIPWFNKSVTSWGVLVHKMGCIF